MKRSFILCMMLGLVLSCPASFGAQISTVDVNQFDITFKLLEEVDLPLVFTWAHRPFVKPWFRHEAVSWEEFLTFHQDIKMLLGSGNEFLAYSNERPFAYIRYYDAHIWSDGFGDVDPEGTYGIDLYIGELDYIGRGYGTAMLYQFMKKIIEDQKAMGKPIKQFVIDPEAANVAAIKTYQKVGFTIERIVDDPYWGTQCIMVLDPELVQ